MNPTPFIALMASQEVPADTQSAGPPDWIQLLPVAPNGRVESFDNRGPYSLQSADDVIAASFGDRDRLEVDINHSSFLSAPKGGRSDAVGWITEMQARADGIWGRVDWTEEGTRLVTGRAYRLISPAIRHDGKKRITQILNASLVNRPNLRGMAALHHQQEDDMTLLEKLIAALGLAEGASEDDAMTALQSRLEDDAGVELQSRIDEIGLVLGVDGGDAAAILAAAKARPKGGETALPEEVVALQAEVAELTRKLNDGESTRAREAATAFIDAEIKRGRAGLKPVRDRYIEMHMEDATRTRELVEALPVLTGHVTETRAPKQEGGVALQAEQLAAARLLGLDPEDYRKTLEQEAN